MTYWTKTAANFTASSPARRAASFSPMLYVSRTSLNTLFNSSGTSRRREEFCVIVFPYSRTSWSKSFAQFRLPVGKVSDYSSREAFVTLYRIFRECCIGYLVMLLACAVSIVVYESDDHSTFA